MDSKEENDMHNSRNEHGGRWNDENEEPKHCNMKNNIKNERNEQTDWCIRQSYTKPLFAFAIQFLVLLCWCGLL